MPGPYHLRTHYELSSDFEEEDAEFSSVCFNATSSPVRPMHLDLDDNDTESDDLTFNDLAGLLWEGDETDDTTYIPSSSPTRSPTATSTPRTSRAAPQTDDEKALAVLAFMKLMLSRMSLRKLLRILFSSTEPRIRNVVAMFLLDDEGPMEIAELWYKGKGKSDYTRPFTGWVVEKAAGVCGLEFGWLTDQASKGPHFAEAEALRVKPEKVRVAMVKAFSIRELDIRYHRLLPHTSAILEGAIGKGDTSGSRNTKDGQTFMVSQALNLRSRLTNYHAIHTGLVFRHFKPAKRLRTMFNRIGITISGASESKVAHALYGDAVHIASVAANDLTKIRQLNYDNFNWRENVWESSALNALIQHDQVSAILTIPWIPSGFPSAQFLMDLSRWDALAGTRHQIPPHQSLRDITPNSGDIISFRHEVSMNIATILTEEISSWSSFRSHIPQAVDPNAITPHKTEKYYLPTFDQEQGSTRGNMIVVRHYFLKILHVPEWYFEKYVFPVLGDRLTTARVRAAQDQRGADTSTKRVDHMSSIPVSNGVMHTSLCFINNVGKNCWGDETVKDAVSLLTLRDQLPNRANINLRNVDFYAWLRFLDVVLRSLVLTATAAELSLDSASKLAEHRPLDMKTLLELCDKIAMRCCLLPIDNLEEAGVKTLKGHTESGHAVLLMRDLMTLRIARHAVKHGHPTRMVRIFKFWMPMFYAGNSSNYANEMMELLHNIHHDWPKDSARVQVAAMLVNNRGEADSFLEADLDVEHLNRDIKDGADGPNATPQKLERETPIIGHCKDLTSRTLEELGVEKINAHHAHVRQHKDIELLSKYLDENNIFRFTKDKSSQHAVVDLYHHGLRRVSGPDGGHSKHLARHRLRFLTRHDANTVTSIQPWMRDAEGPLDDLEKGWDVNGLSCNMEEDEEDEIEEVEAGTYIP